VKRKALSITPNIANRKLAIGAAIVIIVLVIIDLLATRQILYFDNTGQTVVFILTVVIAYGIGSWVLLGYTGQISKELRAKSRFINITYWGVTMTQFSLFGILLYIIYNNGVNCYEYFTFCNSSVYQRTLVFAISTIAATFVMGIISFKFFSWFRLSYRNYMLLLYGLAALTSGISIAINGGTKLLLSEIVEEESLGGAVPESAWIYKTYKQYDGEVQHKVVNPITTVLYVVPTDNLQLYKNLIYVESYLPYIFTWAATVVLLREFYKRKGKIPLIFWVVLSIPLLLYLIGSFLVFALPADNPYKYYYRLVFRAGTIGSSVLFGFAFYVITRNVTAGKIKDYLAITAIGIMIIGMANGISGYQQTYGIAAHSLVLLASYLYSFGFYFSAISISHDNSLRHYIREFAKKESRFLDSIGRAQQEQEVQRVISKVYKAIREQEQALKEETAIGQTIDKEDMENYVGVVLKEVNEIRKQDPTKR
jgi:hypothetical protein